jgi:hypothetical protein
LRSEEIELLDSTFTHAALYQILLLERGFGRGMDALAAFGHFPMQSLYLLNNRYLAPLFVTGSAYL